MEILISKLVSTDKDDLLNFIRKQNLEDHFLFTRWKDVINSPEKLLDIAENECNLSQKVGLRIIGRSSIGEICAFGLIDFFSQKEKKHVALVGTIVDKEFRQKGIGKQMLKEEIYQSELHHKSKIRASAHEHNIASIKLHKSLGFIQEGKFIAEEFNGKFLNVVSMALFVDSNLIQ